MVLNGIDIASYQDTLHAGNITGDFVIIKATEGLSYVNPSCDKHFQQAKKAGKLLGVYHFAQTNDAKAEADYFLKNIKNYIGEALLVLDYEEGALRNGTAWVKVFLDRVQQQTGIKALVYTSLSVTNEQNWQAVVSADYGLWVAQYNTNNVQNGFAHPSITGKVGYWPAVAIHQYTSHGHLPNYKGDLDFNYFNGDKKAWLAYAGKSTDSGYHHKKDCYYKVISDKVPLFHEASLSKKYYGYFSKGSLIWIGDISEEKGDKISGKNPCGWLSLSKKEVTPE